MTKGKDLRPLTTAQRQSAARYPWYRKWLLDSGRTEADVDAGRPKPTTATVAEGRERL